MCTNENIDLSLIEQDEFNDGFSLIWENGCLSKVEDYFDTEDLSEGRMGEFETKRIFTATDYVIIIPLVKKNSSLFYDSEEIDTDNKYQLAGNDRVLTFEIMSEDKYRTRTKELEEAETIKISCNKEPYLAEFEGLVYSSDDKKMIGKQSFLKSNGIIYGFLYAGEGNYTDIKMEGAFVLKRIINQMI